MASRTCWNCDAYSHMTLVTDPVRTQLGEFSSGAFRCDHCGHLSIGMVSPDVAADMRLSVKDYMRTQETPDLTWLPERIAGKDFPDVPPHIASAADEAHRCNSVSAYRAAILLGRSVVEATAKEKGITTGTLASKIDQLLEAEHIRPMIANTAHEIRHLGNDMAHGDFVEPVTRGQAADVLFFMDEVLDEVYQGPARVNARRASRIAAKADKQQ